MIPALNLDRTSLTNVKPTSFPVGGKKRDPGNEADVKPQAQHGKAS